MCVSECSCRIPSAANMSLQRAGPSQYAVHLVPLCISLSLSLSFFLSRSPSLLSLSNSPSLLSVSPFSLPLFSLAPPYLCSSLLSHSSLISALHHSLSLPSTLSLNFSFSLTHSPTFSISLHLSLLPSSCLSMHLCIFGSPSLSFFSPYLAMHVFHHRVSRPFQYLCYLSSHSDSHRSHRCYEKKQSAMLSGGLKGRPRRQASLPANYFVCKHTSDIPSYSK